MVENNYNRDHEAVSEADKSSSVLRDSKPNCYKCKHRGSADYSAHSTCNHPYTQILDGAGKFLPVMYMIRGLRSPIEKRMNVTYSQHGFNNGWFMWPINFDPVWLESCDGFEEMEKE